MLETAFEVKYAGDGSSNISFNSKLLETINHLIVLPSLEFIYLMLETAFEVKYAGDGSSNISFNSKLLETINHLIVLPSLEFRAVRKEIN